METRLQQEIETHPYPLLFASLSGAHLYGFPSPDSDYDMRGVHILPVRTVLSMKAMPETIERSYERDGMEMDLVTHDVKKFFQLMLKRNGYVLEQLYSPLVLSTSEAHGELKDIGAGCITKHHAYHYLGFAENQINFLEQEEQPRVKPLLYIYRVLLTGINLMREGVIEANLVKLNEAFNLECIPELIEQKMSGEQTTAKNLDPAFHMSEFKRLIKILEQERDRSLLPEEATAHDALDDLLVRIRLGE